MFTCLSACMDVCVLENVGVSECVYMYVHTFMHVCTCMCDRANSTGTNSETMAVPTFWLFFLIS